MKIKSLLSFALALIICLTVMCGCNKKSTDDSVSTSDESAVTETTSTAESTPKEVLNILILGIDDINDLGTSDAVLMLSIDETNSKARVVSFNRDTYVYIPSYGNNNLNYAYKPGNTELMVKTVEDNFAVNIDNYALANYFSFEDMVNAVGGIEMTLTNEEIHYINKMMESQGNTEKIEAEAGVIKLSGLQALCHMRNRTDANGENDEFSRASRQTEFIKALINGLKNASVEELKEIITSVLPYLHTDLTREEAQNLVKNFKIYLNYNVETIMMPSEGTYDVVGGKSDPRIIVNDWNKTRADLKAFLYGE